MNESETTAGPGPSWSPLVPRERRVAGVLVEKAKTTPEYYPLTVAGIVAGCNQKSNRDPLTSYNQDDVEETLHGLRKKGAVILVEGTGRVARWKHLLYDWLKVSKVELAVLAELLLRGPQTEGDLRARASRMEPLADLAALQAVLEALAARGLVVYLSPPGQKRGVLVTHSLYPAQELAKLREALAARRAGDDDETPARLAPARVEPAALAATPDSGAEIAALRAEVESLRGAVAALTAEVRELKSALGA
jgi:uncharacterized protein YceH (UPF0502 family)